MWGNVTHKFGWGGEVQGGGAGQSSDIYYSYSGNRRDGSGYDAAGNVTNATDANGNITSAIELDPWGAKTNLSGSSAFQPKKFTSYERDSNGSDEAIFRRYNRKHSRFDQADPYDGSYSLTCRQRPAAFAPGGRKNIFQLGHDAAHDSSLLHNRFRKRTDAG
ncbi:MAG TPA: hypothetical protein DC047_20590, partial [Blastocatellia bacterium]|nr:hypothetical protein [Blastocatellia bacterium]